MFFFLPDSVGQPDECGLRGEAQAPGRGLLRERQERGTYSGTGTVGTYLPTPG